MMPVIALFRLIGRATPGELLYKSSMFMLPPRLLVKIPTSDFVLGPIEIPNVARSKVLPVCSSGSTSMFQNVSAHFSTGPNSIDWAQVFYHRIFAKIIILIIH
jgi:hypothetical protein